MKNKELDPNKTILICKFEGKEVGRIAASAKNAEAYVTELGKHYGELQIDYEEDNNAWLSAAILS